MSLHIERARELLRYESDTGAMFWRVDRGQRVKAGDQAGYRTAEGYIGVRVEGAFYLAHRLAWFLTTWAWPTHGVDHINGVRGDNTWANLRDVPQTENMQNRRGPTVRNRLGLAGVSQEGARFRAKLVVDGATTHLGMFDTPEAASAAYVAAKRRLHAGNTL